MKTKDGKHVSTKNASSAMPSTLKSNQVGDTIRKIADAVRKRGLTKKPGQRE